MRTLLAAAFGAALLILPAAGASAAERDFGPLISAAALAAAQPAVDPLILDIRGAEVSDGRIPGAVSAPYGQFRGPQENPGQLLSEAEFTALFQRLGVRLERPTVIVHQGRDATDFGAAARVYWTLKTAGVEELAILNGGMNAWTADGARPVSQTAATPRPSDVTVRLSDTWLAERDEVLAIIEGAASGRLIDARPEAFYKGDQAHPAAAKPGTLPQSDYFTHSGWFDGGPAIIDAEAARSLAQANGFRDGDKLVSFCNTGHWAATNWFALSELAGIDGVRLYPESMVGWSHAGLPMANTPSLVENLLDQIREAL